MIPFLLKRYPVIGIMHEIKFQRGLAHLFIIKIHHSPGRRGIDGKLPVNVSGGLKAKGHPVSATGIGMIYEIVKQIRGECEDRQLSNVRNALAQNIGGAGGTTTCTILKKN